MTDQSFRATVESVAELLYALDCSFTEIRNEQSTAKDYYIIVLVDLLWYFLFLTLF